MGNMLMPDICNYGRAKWIFFFFFFIPSVLHCGYEMLLLLEEVVWENNKMDKNFFMKREVLQYN